MVEASFNTYISEVEAALKRGDSTEHTHRAALAALIESVGKGVKAVNEPSRIACGAPDLLVARGRHSIGYIEAKDVGKSLDEAEKTVQFDRYRKALSNLILTDYLEFRWYTEGEHRASFRLGTADSKGNIRIDEAGVVEAGKILGGFMSCTPEPVKSPRVLAGKMARMAQMARELIENTIGSEAERGSLHQQLDAFRENLIPELSTAQFADMYAQTIAYGLFAAKCNTPPGKEFVRRDAAYLIPRTNPFLRNVFNHIAGPELDERIAWLVDDLVGLLDAARMDEVLEGFGRMTGRKDPVLHFYETFLSEYDPALREVRGVYYTPEEVVSYIVRSVDSLLKSKLAIQDGLADKDALILDPAAGTGTFLYAVVNQIYNSPHMQGMLGAWDAFVSERLLSNMFGFELLMAPYTIAHLKLALQLKETGYTFEADQRLGIYLTNTLDEAKKHSDLLLAKWLTDESNSAAVIKKDKPVMVVLGNPPYSGHSANTGEWITRLINAYKTVDGMPLGERNPKWLQDDYVKFIRFGQWRIDKTGQGILAFITNHGYLDNPTFRGMRQSLMETFDEIYVYDLHGNSKKKERAPDGGKDENVFDIQQGVAITLMIKRPSSPVKAVKEARPGTQFTLDIDVWNRPENVSSPKTLAVRRLTRSLHEDTSKYSTRAEGELAKVFHAELWGPREDKYARLLKEDVTCTNWQELTPHTPSYLFVPRDESLLNEYEKGWKVTDVFPVNSVGVVTSRDQFVMDFDKETLKSRIKDFLNPRNTDEDVRRRYFGTTKREEYLPGDNRDWNMSEKREALLKEKGWERHITKCLYRPFDERFIFYHKDAIDFGRQNVLKHMQAGRNIGLIATRQVTSLEFCHINATRNIVELKVGSHDRNTYIFPLYLFDVKPDEQGETRRPNLSQDFVDDISNRLRLKFVSDGRGDRKKTFGPEDVFNYMYAVFHSPAYRKRYAEFLKSDFPHLPLTSDKNLFFRLADKGAELVQLHLLEATDLNVSEIAFLGKGDREVKKVSYDQAARRVYINEAQYFDGVAGDVWDFHVGGYRVAEKWLKDRKGRKLGFDEVTRYREIAAALSVTIRLMSEIAALIPSWPMK